MSATNPSAPEPINLEQLEAEFCAGCRVARNLDVSLTTLAHLVMAAQYALQDATLVPSARAVLRAFATEATERADFPPETLKLINRGWS